MIAMTSVSDTDEGFQRLVKAFLEIDSEIGLKNEQMNASKQMALNDVVEAMEDAMGRLPKNPQVMNMPTPMMTTDIPRYSLMKP